MNAKELRAAAEYITQQWDDHDSKRLVSGDELFLNSDGEPDAVTFARHILSTVREDDDEPVTVEGLVALGGVRYANRPLCVTFNRMEFMFDEGESSLACVCVWCRETDMAAISLTGCMLPRNMKDARELLVRRGAIEDAK